MRSLVPYNKLHDLLKQREERMRDLVVPADRMSMCPETGNMIMRDGNSEESYRIQDQAINLLGQKLNVPASYLRRCKPPLRATNTNHWLRKLGGKEMLVRFDRDEVRAVLSKRYSPVSNLSLIEYFADRADRYEIDFDLNAIKFIARFVDKKSRAEMGNSDEMLGGLTIINSECGYASVQVSGFMFRTLCMNGLIVHQKYIFRKMHTVSRSRYQRGHKLTASGAR